MIGPYSNELEYCLKGITADQLAGVENLTGE